MVPVNKEQAALCVKFVLWPFKISDLQNVEQIPFVYAPYWPHNIDLCRTVKR